MDLHDEKEFDLQLEADRLKWLDAECFEVSAELGNDYVLKHLSEGLSELREKLKAFKGDSLKEQVEEAKAEQERIVFEEKLRAVEDVDQYYKKVTYEVNQDVEKYYQPIYRAVDKVCKGYSNLLFVKGIGGIGKSFTIRRCLTENNTQYLEIAGEVTEAYLYRLLYENNGKIIWLKDVANLLNGLKSINILKAATETEEARIITKNNYSKNQDDLPDRFICKCKFIFDYNNIQNNMRDDFEALISRGDFIEFALSKKEMEHIMRCIAKTPESKEVTEFVIKNFTGSGLVRLNLRTQWKALNTYNYALSEGRDWKEEITNELRRVSKVRAMLYSLIGNEAVRRVDLKKLLIKHELVNSIRMADHKIKEWLFTDELYSWSKVDEYNGYIALIPKGDDKDEES
jgi:hypothetical protein